MMSFRRQDVRSYWWVGRLGEDHFGNQRGMKVNECTEKTVIVLSQYSSMVLGYVINSQFSISALKAAMLILYYQVMGGARQERNQINSSAFTLQNWAIPVTKSPKQSRKCSKVIIDGKWCGNCQLSATMEGLIDFFQPIKEATESILCH